MDFEAALKKENIDHRIESIEKEINEHDWFDSLTSYCVHGGYPTDILVSNIEIEGDLEEIIANFNLNFTESVPTSCKDQILEYKVSAFISVSIKRQNGQYVINSEYGDEDDLFCGDYL